jgi:glucose/arabinose dehydrogenase
MRLARAALLVALPLLASCGKGDTTSPDPGPGPTDGSCPAGSVVSGLPALTTVRVAGGLQQPLDLQSVPGDRARLYVVEQAGRIRVIRDGVLQPEPFLDIVSRVGAGGERGLLGLAFHPQFATRRTFYVNYTDKRGDTHIVEFRANGEDRAAPFTEREIFFTPQPFANHNGGGLAFGPDGRLYAGLGDGGSGGDPLGNAQDLATPLGKMLRFDVDAGPPFVPADNPFRAQAGAEPHVWAAGLRNPWRFAFDRATGDLFIADVGQGRREEINVGLASRRGGENYGWNVTEGTLCFSPASGCNTQGLTPPLLDYGHDAGCSITGGVVYRGCRMPALQGAFFYGDYCSNVVRSLRLADGRAADERDWTATLGRGLGNLGAFGVDADGEMYLVDHGRGDVYRIVPVS